MVPLPSLSVPFQTADASLSTVSSFVFFGDTKLLGDRRQETGDGKEKTVETLRAECASIGPLSFFLPVSCLLSPISCLLVAQLRFQECHCLRPGFLGCFGVRLAVLLP